MKSCTLRELQGKKSLKFQPRKKKLQKHDKLCRQERKNTRTSNRGGGGGGLGGKGKQARRLSSIQGMEQV